MSTKSTKNTLLLLTILLCIVVVGLGAYTIKFYGEVQENESRLKEEKALIQKELKQEIKRYNDVLTEKNILANELSDAKEHLEELQKELDSNEVTQSVVRAYRIELSKVRREREFLFKQNDSLLNETERLVKLQEKTQDSLQKTQDSLEKAKEAQNSLENDKKALERRLDLGAQFTVSNLIAKGVIQRNSGKMLNTVRAGRAEMIRVCYVINENKLAKAGNLNFFVQVLNSQGKMIGIPREEKLSSGDYIRFNVRTTVPYSNKPFSVCELVLPVQTFEKGTYTINVLHEDRLLLTSSLDLK